MTPESGNPDFDSLFPAAQLDRRGFLATALGVGFAMAAGPWRRRARSRPTAAA